MKVEATKQTQAYIKMMAPHTLTHCEEELPLSHT